MERRSEDSAGREVVRSAEGVTLSGDIDEANVPEIERRLCAVLEAGDVVVDGRAVTFLDVAGLRMLARVGVAAAAAGAVVRMRCSPAMTETFNVCGVRELPGLKMEREWDDHDGAGSRQ
jgi:anti-anti-sigma factor